MVVHLTDVIDLDVMIFVFHREARQISLGERALSELEKHITLESAGRVLHPIPPKKHDGEFPQLHTTIALFRVIRDAIRRHGSLAHYSVCSGTSRPIATP